MLALLATLVAHAGAPTLSAAGGWDGPSREAWVGLEAALHPTNREGFGFAASVAPGYGLWRGTPMAIVEVGLLHFVPSQRGLVRFGLFSRNLLIAAPYRVPAQFASAGEARLGLAPGLLAHVEFEFGPAESPFTFAVRAGMASSLFNFRCEDPSDLGGCAVWDLAFVGSVELAKRFESGLSIDVAAGPVSKLAVGWAF